MATSLLEHEKNAVSVKRSSSAREKFTARVFQNKIWKLPPPFCFYAAGRSRLPGKGNVSFFVSVLERGTLGVHNSLCEKTGLSTFQKTQHGGVKKSQVKYPVWPFAFRPLRVSIWGTAVHYKDVALVPKKASGVYSKQAGFCEKKIWHTPQYVFLFGKERKSVQEAAPKK